MTTNRVVRILVVLALGLLSSSVAGQASVVPGTRPDTAWQAPVLVSGTQAHRETSLALNPADPTQMFVCDPSGVPNTAGNQSYFHRSADGGATWKYTDVEGGTTDTRNYAFEGGDCDVAYDQGGTAYTADTWLGSLSVGHSTDGGQTWDGTAIAGTTPVVDRPWLVGGPPGTLYVSYQDLQCCLVSAMWFTKSTDYGKTFLPAVPITTANNDGAFTWEGNFVVAPGGQDLYLVYTRRQGPAVGSLDSQGPETVWVASSHNGGLTWASTKVASMPNPASYLYPSIAMDAAGTLHVVYSSRRIGEDRPIWYAASSDRALTWTAPVPLSPGTSGYSPWIAAGAEGEAVVAWLGSPDPEATETTTSDWYFNWARISGGGTAAPTITRGLTTSAPMFTGKQVMPEFEMVRLDADGMAHLGMSVYYKPGTAAARWSVWYQREVLVD